MDETSPHLIGEGHMRVPPAESHSGRFGAVMLLNEGGTPVPLREFKVIGTAVLTATIPAETAHAVGRPAQTELLGAGALFFERTVWNGRPAMAVGVRPRDGRLEAWLDPRTVIGLKDLRIRLEAHESWPTCRCQPVQWKPSRRKRSGTKRRPGGGA